jgi:Tfp pilus assembly protein PilF
MASQYGNLGIVYKARGDLDRAEEMHRKSLELFTSIGSKPMIEKAESLIAALKHGDGRVEVHPVRNMRDSVPARRAPGDE